MTPVPDDPGIIAPPPLIFAGFLLLGLLMDAVTGDLGIRLPGWLRWIVGAGLVYAGIRILVETARALRRTGGRLAPWRASTTLATDGIFSRSRNPACLAMALVQAGLALVFDSIFALLLLAAAIATVQVGVIAREERFKQARFGEAFVRYRRSVRAWL